MITKWTMIKGNKKCTGICYEWHEIKGKIKDTVNCKHFQIKSNRMKCLAHPNKKIKRITAGEVFYSKKI